MQDVGNVVICLMSHEAPTKLLRGFSNVATIGQAVNNISVITLLLTRGGVLSHGDVGSNFGRNDRALEI